MSGIRNQVGCRGMVVQEDKESLGAPEGKEDGGGKSRV